MIRYLLVLFIIVLLVAIYNIVKQIPQSLKISREKRRRREEHREYMTAYNTRRQLYSDAYNVSRRFNLTGSEDAQSQSIISGCSEDNEVEIGFDESMKKYAVSCGGGRIGYLPPAAGDVLGKLSDYKAIISALGFTKSDKYYVQVTIYSNT